MQTASPNAKLNMKSATSEDGTKRKKTGRNFASPPPMSPNQKPAKQSAKQVAAIARRMIASSVLIVGSVMRKIAAPARTAAFGIFSVRRSM